MSTRLVNLLALAMVTGVAAGCGSSGVEAPETQGFLQGLADGFLILVDFLRGKLAADGRPANLLTSTSYGLGYIAGAASFIGLGTAFSAS